MFSFLRHQMKAFVRSVLKVKTFSYMITHILVATTVGWALTGNLVAALGYGLIEPAVQTILFSQQERFWNVRITRRGLSNVLGIMPLRLAKTIVYCVIHLSGAFAVGYALTHNLEDAAKIGLIEPAVQTVVYYFHDRAWSNIEKKRKTLPAQL